MKRALGLIIIVAACAMGFLSIRGALPFMPVAGTSMEPVFHAGDLIFIKETSPSRIEVGDVIVYNVPPMVQDAYNYPPVVAHRVIRITTFGNSVAFRTKGDNTGEDPITVRPQDLRGVVSSHYASLGFPLLFFQSQQGVIFAIISLSLLALFLYSDELSMGSRKLQGGIFAPVIRESSRANRVLYQKIESTGKKIDTTEQALEKFSAAIAEYAQHLASHTSAIQGLAEASHELKRSAAEQNRVLAHLMQNMGEPKPSAPETPKKAFPPADKLDIEAIIRANLEEGKPDDSADVKEKAAPPGCFKSRRVPAAQNHGHKPFSGD